MTKLTESAQLPGDTELLEQVRALIAEAKQNVAIQVNAHMTLLYWRIGERIQLHVLDDSRAGYGMQIVKDLGLHLNREFGKGFAEKSLRRMVQFYLAFADPQIVATLSRQLSWSHFVELLPVKEPLARDFYLQMAINDGWSVRTLRNRIDSMLFERTALSKKPDQLIAAELENLAKTNALNTSMVLKDPYLFDFLGIRDHYFEKDLEDAILRELDKSDIHVAEYLTVLPPKDVLQQKLNQAINESQARLGIAGESHGA